MKYFALIALLVAGCIAPPSSAPNAAMTDGGALPDVSIDEDAGTTPDAASRPDIGDQDYDGGGGTDAGSTVNGGRDAAEDRCETLGRPIGLWNMEQSVGDEVANVGAGDVPALLLTNATLEAGRGGNVLVTAGAGDIEPYIPDAPAFDLDAGTVALWLRSNEPGLNGDRGLVSRDAIGQNLNGHWTVELRNGRPYARLQNTTDVVELSLDRQIPADTWGDGGLSPGLLRTLVAVTVEFEGIPSAQICHLHTSVLCKPGARNLSLRSLLVSPLC